MGAIYSRENPSFSLSRYYLQSHATRILDALILSTLLFVVLYSPLPFGSVQPSSMFVIQIASLLAVLLWMSKLIFCADLSQLSEFRHLHHERKNILTKRPLSHRYSWLSRILRFITFGKWPRRYRAENLVDEENDSDRFPYYSVFGFPVRNTGIEKLAVLFLLLMALQIVPLPSQLIALISPVTENLYHSAARFTGAPLRYHPISLDAFTSLSKIVEYVSYFFLYITAVNCLGKKRSYWLMLGAIFCSAVFQATYGLYEFLSGHQHIFAYQKKFGLDSASGTFINRNHYAAYLEVSLPLLIGLVIGKVDMLKGSSPRLISRLGRAFETRGSQVLLLLFLIVLVAVALIFSLSRSGITFGIISLLVFLFLYWKTKQQLSRKTYLLLGIGATLALSIWIGLTPLLQRFLNISENWNPEETRWVVWKDTLHMFHDFPVVGTGSGTFRQVYPLYRSFVYQSIYNQAHNDYIQFLAETGILTLLFICWFFFLLHTRLDRVRRKDLSRLGILQIACFCSLLSLGLHSLTDFGVQIPAIAVLAAIITGMFFTDYHADFKRSF
jgi:putative inorganic carbon (HCO3(-)) transporter